MTTFTLHLNREEKNISLIKKWQMDDQHKVPCSGWSLEDFTWVTCKFLLPSSSSFLCIVSFFTRSFILHTDGYLYTVSLRNCYPNTSAPSSNLLFWLLELSWLNFTRLEVLYNKIQKKSRSLNIHMKHPESQDFVPYSDVFPFKTGSQSDGVLKCLNSQ